jgi:hypothetical protein
MTLYTWGKLDEGQELIRDNNFEYGMHYHVLAHQQIDRKLNPLLVEYSKGKLERDFLMHDSDEFFVLLEGELNFYISDETTCKHMNANDTLYLSANVPHKVRLAPECDYAKALIIYENSSKL